EGSIISLVSPHTSRRPGAGRLPGTVVPPVHRARSQPRRAERSSSQPPDAAAGEGRARRAASAAAERIVRFEVMVGAPWSAGFAGGRDGPRARGGNARALLLIVREHGKVPGLVNVVAARNSKHFQPSVRLGRNERGRQICGLRRLTVIDREEEKPFGRSLPPPRCAVRARKGAEFL